ncbi:uncharacterized protein LOC110683975 [Chenopodium quinoa]|nr:uncharacterized protein LOC110683975 [Chenopodium quinoa]
MGYAKDFGQYLINLFIVIKKVIYNVIKFNKPPIFYPIGLFLLSNYYYYCGLSPCMVDLDDQTTMHFWISNYRRHDRPNLVLVHGCGGEARWQFCLQIRELSKLFNIYIPDLLFYGKSYTTNTDRTPRFQAKCIMEGLKKGFGVEKCTVYSISYGGWVGYFMAEIYPDIIEKNVIVSSGVGTTDDEKVAQLSRVGKQPEEVIKTVVPKDPDAIRLLVEKSIYKYDPTLLVPDFILWEFIKVTEHKNREEKEELLRSLISGEVDSAVSALPQETLLVWGDQDYFFPKHIAHQLQRKLGPKATLTIIKETGHGVNMDSPYELNELIKTFVFGQLHK